ncbi:MAG TPA: hypothetical protein VFI15_07230 [Candidatus Limnocylindrales bacterium]|nr:hypothetical protein [Candidatus Limnocylindrales bacterium]
MTAAPTVDATAGLVDAALTFAEAAGYDVVSETAAVLDRHAAGYEPSVLWRVAIPVSGEAGPAILNVYLDDARTVRVAEAELGFPVEPNGSAISRADAIAEAVRVLGLVGIATAPHDLSIWSSIPGQLWTLGLDRDIDGHPVANHWAATGLAGDRVWVTLNGAGRLAELYAVRPERDIAADVLSNAELTDRLAEVAGLTQADLAVLDPSLIWLRALDQEGVESTTLSLNYCATRTGTSGWESWCVDASSGEPSAHGLAAD